MCHVDVEAGAVVCEIHVEKNARFLFFDDKAIVIAGHVKPNCPTVERVGNRCSNRGGNPRHRDFPVASGVEEAFE